MKFSDEVVQMLAQKAIAKLEALGFKEILSSPEPVARIKIAEAMKKLEDEKVGDR